MWHRALSAAAESSSACTKPCKRVTLVVRCGQQQPRRRTRANAAAVESAPRQLGASKRGQLAQEGSTFLIQRSEGVQLEELSLEAAREQLETWLAHDVAPETHQVARCVPPGTAPSGRERLLSSALASTSQATKASTVLIRSTRTQRGKQRSVRRASAGTSEVGSVSTARGRKLRMQAPRQQQKQQQEQLVDLEEGITAGDQQTQDDAAVLVRLRAQLDNATNRERPDASHALGHFLANVYHAHLLTPAEERALGRSVQRGRRLASVRKEAELALTQQLDRAPSGDELDMQLGDGWRGEHASAQAAADEAADLLVRYNLGLAVMLAKRYSSGVSSSSSSPAASSGRTAGSGSGRRGHGAGGLLALEDLVHAALGGLRAASGAYDPDRGARFSTYAVLRVRQAVRRCVEDHGRSVRVPVHVQVAVGKIRRIALHLSQEAGRVGPVTTEEVAQAVGLPKARVLKYLRAVREPSSLEGSAMGHGNDPDGSADTLLDTVASASDAELASAEDAADSAVDAQRLAADLDTMLATLPRTERDVLRMRYGLLPRAQLQQMTYAAGLEEEEDEDSVDSGVGLQPHSGGRAAAGAVSSTAALGQPMSLKQAAKELGVSIEYVRILERRALAKLRAPYRRETFLRDWVPSAAAGPGAMAPTQGALAQQPRWQQHGGMQRDIILANKGSGPSAVARLSAQKHGWA